LPEPAAHTRGSKNPANLLWNVAESGLPAGFTDFSTPTRKIQRALSLNYTLRWIAGYAGLF